MQMADAQQFSLPVQDTMALLVLLMSTGLAATLSNLIARTAASQQLQNWRARARSTSKLPPVPVHLRL